MPIKKLQTQKYEILIHGKTSKTLCKVMNYLMAAWQDILSVVLPAHCIVCHESLYAGAVCKFCKPHVIRDFEYRCQSCFKELNFLKDAGNICNVCVHYPLPFRQLRYIWNYSAGSRDFIRTMKYKPAVKLIETAAHEVNLVWEQIFKDKTWDYIMPIPANPKRLKQRGLNQSEYLVRLLIKYNFNSQYNIMLKDVLLPAKPKRKPQAELSANQRIRNMLTGFKLKHSCNIDGKSILIVDDVVTTGSSITAASLALLEHGASYVDVLVLAAAPKFNQQRFQLWSSFIF